MATPSPMPASSSNVRPKAGHRTPGITRPGSPTAATPATRGRQYHGPAISPIRNAPTAVSITSKSTRLPWPDCPSRSERLSRLPRGETRWRMIAIASGIARVPKARNAPELPIIVPNRNGAVGARTAAGTRRAGGGGPGQVAEGGRPRRLQQVVQRGRPGGARPRHEEAVKALAPVRDLHDREGRVEQEPRHDQPPDQVQPPEAVGEVRDGPEDPQAGRGGGQPAHGGRAVQAGRRADPGGLGEDRLGVVGVGQVGRTCRGDRPRGPRARSAGPGSRARGRPARRPGRGPAGPAR